MTEAAPQTREATEREPLRCFWNLSNHPIDSTWTKDQIRAARHWKPGTRLELKEYPFPTVDPAADADQIRAIAVSTAVALLDEGARPGEPVMVMGEFTLTCALVQQLRGLGFVPVTATTFREAEETMLPDGSRILKHRFRFVQFREY